MTKITARLIDTTKPETKDVVIRDSELKGFICKITPKGKKIYMLYYRTKSGRERRPSIGIHGHITCYQAREMAMNWLSDVNKGGDPSQEKKSHRTNATITSLAERYITEYAYIQKKPKSVVHDKFLLKNHILPSLGKINLNSLTNKDVNNLHYKMQNIPTTANRCIALLSKMLNLAEKWGLLLDAGSLCRRIDKYKENKRERFLSIEEIQKVSSILKEAALHTTEHSSVIAAIKLLLLTGCRLSEIITLKWEYIAIAHCKFNLPDSKTGKKTVYFSPYVIDVLNGINKKKGNPYVIYGLVEGRHLINLQKAWCRIRKLAGLDDVRIHDLRHSFASVGAASGLSLPIIGALLGHTQAQTTARYAHLLGDPLREAASVIGEKMKSVAG